MASWTWYGSYSSLTGALNVYGFAGDLAGQTLIAATDAGVLWSANKGASWSLGVGISASVSAVASNNDGTIMYATTSGATGSLYVSTNQGVTWSTVSTQPTACAVNPPSASATWYTGICANGTSGTAVVYLTTNKALGGTGCVYLAGTSGSYIWACSSAASPALVNQALVSIACTPTGSAYLAVASDNSGSGGYQGNAFYSNGSNGWNGNATRIRADYQTTTFRYTACSGNGNTFILCSSGHAGTDTTGYIFTISTTNLAGGVASWTQQSSANLPYYYCAISYNGSNLYGCVPVITGGGGNNGLYYSLSGGAWTLDTTTVSLGAVNAVYPFQPGTNQYLPEALGIARSLAAGGSVTLYYSFPVICFKEGTKILCLVDNKETYLPIEYIAPGTLVKTRSSGYKKVELIGHSKIYNPSNSIRGKNRLYKCTKTNYPEVFEDLIVTGCHSILVDDITDEQRKDITELAGRIFITEDKYRLMACLDERAEPYTEEGVYTVWHFALENDNYYFNYGVYANGLLVESTSQRMMKELSGMELV